MKQTSEFKLLFKRPITKDWVFYVYLVSVAIDSLGSISTVLGQGGPFLDNSASVVSGSIDALSHLLISYVLVFPILIIRRVIAAGRSRKTDNSETASDEVVTLNDVSEKEFFQQIKNRFNSKREFYLLFCSSTLVILAVLLPYDNRNFRLIDDAGNRTYNLVPILLIVGLTVFAYFRKSDEILLAGLIPLVYWHMQGNVSNIGFWLIGDRVPGIGSMLELANFVLMSYLVFVLIKRVPKTFVWTTEMLRVAMILSALGIVYVAGSWMDWTKTTKLITLGDSVWSKNNSKESVESCCMLFENTSSWPWQFRDFVFVVGLFVVLYSLIYLVRGSSLGFGIFSVGLVLLSNPLSWIAEVYPKYVDPLTDGFDAKEIEEMGISISQEPMLGGWIALGAAAGYLFYGLYIYASSKIIANSTSNQISI
jgi:hypothetical protein